MRIEIERADVQAAAQAGHLDEAQVERVWTFLVRRVEEDGHVRVSPASGGAEPQGRASPLGTLGFVHVLWFGGALLVLGAMTFFATVGFSAFGGGGLCAIALAYAALFSAVGRAMWRRADMKVLGGLCVTLAVGMVPLATYGAQRALGLWGAEAPGSYGDFYRWIRGGFFAMEVTTLAASLFALSRVRFSFLVVIPSVALWFMSMDLADLLFETVSRATIGWVSVVFGVLMLGAGAALRLRDRADLSFWLDTFALVSLQGGLLAQSSDLVVTKLVFIAVQIGILHLSRIWQRAWPLVVGSVGLVALWGQRIVGHDGAVLLGLVGGAMLFAYGFSIRRTGQTPTATVSFLFAALYALALPYGTLNDSGLGLALHGAVCALFIALAVVARSRLLVWGGGLGVAVLLGELAFDVFKDSMVFPLVLASIGIGVMLLGVALQKKRTQIEAFLDESAPAFVKTLRVPR